MNITIAKKCHGAGIMYILVALFGLAFLIFTLTSNDGATAMTSLVGVLCLILGGFYSVRYLLLPNAIISLTENHQLLLPKGVTIPLETLIDVSYKRAQAKGYQYKWGKIVLQTRDHTYKFDFVADCETVAKHLTKQMYAAKHTDT